MSTVLVVTPLVVAGWPILTAAITAAIGTMGFSMAHAATDAKTRAQSKTVRTEIAVEDSEILAGAGAAGERLVVEREGIRAIFSRDARGALKLCMKGQGHSESELRRIGEELVGRVTQQYVYHRVVSELNERRVEIVEQRVSEDQSITIRIRNT